MSDVPSRACTLCRKVKQLSKEFFHENAHAPDGFRSECRECRKLTREERVKKKREAKLDEVEKGAVDTFIAAARLGGGNVPHARELVEVMMTYFGGVNGFVNMWMKNLYDTPSGSATRAKLLMSIQGLITANTSMGGAIKPLEAMSQQELDDEWERQVKLSAMQMVSTMKVNGENVKLVASENPSEVPLPDPAEFEVVNRNAAAPQNPPTADT